MLARMWRTWNPRALLVGTYTGAAATESETELPSDPAIPLLGTYPKELKAGIRLDISMPVFMQIIAVNKWMQPRCPSTDEEINKVVCGCVYTQ